MNADEKFELVDDWQWDALSGTMQEYIILLRQERNDLLRACKIGLNRLEEINDILDIESYGIEQKLRATIANVEGE